MTAARDAIVAAIHEGTHPSARGRKCRHCEDAADLAMKRLAKLPPDEFMALRDDVERAGAWEPFVGHGGRIHPWSAGCDGAGCDPLFRFVRREAS